MWLQPTSGPCSFDLSPVFCAKKGLKQVLLKWECTAGWYNWKMRKTANCNFLGFSLCPTASVREAKLQTYSQKYTSVCHVSACLLTLFSLTVVCILYDHRVTSGKWAWARSHGNKFSNSWLWSHGQRYGVRSRWKYRVCEWELDWKKSKYTWEQNSLQTIWEKKLNDTLGSIIHRCSGEVWAGSSKQLILKHHTGPCD